LPGGREGGGGSITTKLWEEKKREKGEYSPFVGLLCRVFVRKGGEGEKTIFFKGGGEKTTTLQTWTGGVLAFPEGKKGREAIYFLWEKEERVKPHNVQGIEQ